MRIPTPSPMPVASRAQGTSFLPLIALAVLGLALLATPALAQGVQTGTLTGTVSDSNGDALPGVTVTVSSPSLQGTRTVFTGEAGDYVLRGLPPGAYKVTFELSGMATVERTATLELGTTARSDADMQVATVEETIVVRGETPNALETTQIAANYDAEMVDSLAVGRELSDIAELAPGLTNNTPNEDQVTIAGAFAYDNVFLLDGVDINDNVFGTSNLLFIEDAIEETQVLTNGISAEYGRFSGGVINAITKSGGNSFSGSFRADLTNPAWIDENPLEKQAGIERADEQNEVYQATLGGYVVKDHLWFFLAGRDEALAEQYIFRETNVPFTRDTDNQRVEVKLTGNISSSHTLQGAYTDNERSQTRPSFTFSIEPRTIISRTLPNELSVGRYNGVWTANLFAEAQFSEKEFMFVGSGGTSTVFADSPAITFSAFGQTFSHYGEPYFDATDPQERNNEQVAGSLSYFLSSASLGSHDVKLGFEQFTSSLIGGNSQSASGFVFDTGYLTDAAGNPILDASGRLQPVFTGIGSDSGLNFSRLENWQAVRGSKLDIETTSIFLNDKWRLNDHWSFNLGFRYEDVQGDATGGIVPVDTSALVPRLAASYDVRGDGKYKVDITYAEYAGKYNESQFGANTTAGNPNLLYYLYAGQDCIGFGCVQSPEVAPADWLLVYANFPTQNQLFDADLSSPTAKEFTVSGGVELGRGGYAKLTYSNREFTDFVEDFVEFSNGQTVVDVEGDGSFLVTADNIVTENSNVPQREYEAVQLQARHRINNWSVEGHWTHQLTNDGNFEGEGTNTPGISSVLGDYPEIFGGSTQRIAPVGRLAGFQKDKVRLWTTYNLDFGRAGNLGLSLLYKFDSPLTFSNAANIPVPEVLLASDPGYANPPTSVTVYFGDRGTEEFDSAHTFDFAATYGLPIWKSLEPWVKLEVFNLFNDDTQIGGNISIVPNLAGPLDANGFPTTFTPGVSYRQPTGGDDFVDPREYQVSAGIRF